MYHVYTSCVVSKYRDSKNGLDFFEPYPNEAARRDSRLCGQLMVSKKKDTVIAIATLL